MKQLLILLLAILQVVSPTVSFAAETDVRKITQREFSRYFSEGDEAIVVPGETRVVRAIGKDEHDFCRDPSKLDELGISLNSGRDKELARKICSGELSVVVAETEVYSLDNIHEDGSPAPKLDVDTQLAVASPEEGEPLTKGEAWSNVGSHLGDLVESSLNVQQSARIKWEQEKDGFLGKYTHLFKQTMYFSVIFTGMFVTLWLLPEDVSNWDHEEIRNADAWETWKGNFFKAHFDHDSWLINYVMHVYSGATYHTMARHNGLNFAESCAYSAIISTVVWEALESFAERQSIQDTILTPIVGCMVGEGFIYLENKILANGGKVLGSRFLAETILTLFDPFGDATAWLGRNIGGKLWDSRIGVKIGQVEEAKKNLYSGVLSDDGDSYNNESDVALVFEMKF